VPELRRDLRFLDEALHQLRAALMRFREELDSDVTAELGIPAPEDDAHATAGDPPCQLMAAGRFNGGIGRWGSAGGGLIDRREGVNRRVPQLRVADGWQDGTHRLQNVSVCGQGPPEVAVGAAGRVILLLVGGEGEPARGRVVAVQRQRRGATATGVPKKSRVIIRHLLN
jgi:hypothetical protein